MARLFLCGRALKVDELFIAFIMLIMSRNPAQPGLKNLPTAGMSTTIEPWLKKVMIDLVFRIRIFRRPHVIASNKT